MRKAIAALSLPARFHSMVVLAVKGGHCWRSRLCLDMARGARGDARTNCLLLAAAVELTHAASLIIDDLPLWDNASTRRGAPALFRVHGARAAHMVALALICARDICFNRMRGLSAQRRWQLAKLAAQQTARTAVGQWAEAESTGLDVDGCKTASLFVLALVGTAVLLDMDARAAARLGYHVGKAYQIADDIRDGALDARAWPSFEERMALAWGSAHVLQKSWPTLDELQASV